MKQFYKSSRALTMIVCFMITFCLVLCPMQVSAESDNGEYQTYEDDAGITWYYKVERVYNGYSDSPEVMTILGCDKVPETGILAIPQKINGEEVVAIGESAFYNIKEDLRSKIKEVILPETVLYIKRNAFAHCNNLSNITFPKKLKRILEGSFINCAFTEINLPNNLEYIGNGSFDSCSNLKKVILPLNMSSQNSLLHRPNNVFFDCNNLSEFVVPDNNEEFASVAGIVYTKDMKEIVAYPQGKNEDTFTVPAGVNNICASAFRYSKLKEIILPSELKKIELTAFQCCSELVDMDIPSTVTEIGEYCFQNCTNLKSIVLRNGLLSINRCAFMGCSSLEYIEIPSSVRSINESVFSGVKLIKSVVVPEGITNIKEATFNNCRSLEYVSLPDSLNSIENSAFAGHPDRPNMLSNIFIPQDVTFISDNAFNNCSSDLVIYSKSETAKAFAEEHDLGYVNATRAEYEALIDAEQYTVSCTDHKLTKHDAVPATCNSSGRIEFWSCDKCGRRFSDAAGNNPISATFTSRAAHDLTKTDKVEATETSDGNIAYWTCGNCGKIFSDNKGENEITIEKTVIPKGTALQSGGDAPAPKKVEPKNQSISGKTVFVKSIGSRFSLGVKAKTSLAFRSSNSTIAAVDSKGIVSLKGYGKCKITVTAKATAVYKKAVKTIIVKGFLKKPVLTVKNEGKKSIKLNWSKTEGADGYQVFFKAPGAGKFKLVLTKSYKVKGVKHKRLTKGKKYSYKVRAYKKVNNKKVFSKFSKTVITKIK